MILRLSLPWDTPQKEFCKYKVTLDFYSDSLSYAPSMLNVPPADRYMDWKVSEITSLFISYKICRPIVVRRDSSNSGAALQENRTHCGWSKKEWSCCYVHRWIEDKIKGSLLLGVEWVQDHKCKWVRWFATTLWYIFLYAIGVWRTWSQKVVNWHSNNLCRYFVVIGEMRSHIPRCRRLGCFVAPEI